MPEQNDGTDLAVSDDRVQRMVAAGAAPGATAEPPPTEANDPALTDDATGTESPATTGQPAKPDLAKTVEDLQRKLKEFEDRENNTQRMQSESHRRNTEAAETRRAAEAANVQAQAALKQQEAIAQALANISANADPEVARTLMASLAREQTQAQAAMGNAQLPNGQRQDPMVSQLQGQIEEMRKQINGYAFNVNYGTVASAIQSAVSGQPALIELEKIGRLDEAIQGVMERIVAKDKAEPGSVNPHDPRALAALVRAEVKAEADKWQKLRDHFVNTYREQRKLANAKAPASQKGPSAGVRATQVPTGPTRLPPSGANKDYIEAKVARMLAVSRRPTNGTAPEV